MWRVAVVVLGLAGCYSPSAGDCSYTCAGGSCPAGLTCVQGFCRAPGANDECRTGDGGTGGDGDAINESPYAMAVRQSGPLVWWRLDDVPGATMIKDEMNVAHATNSGATLGTVGFGQSSRAASFSGASCMTAGDFAGAAFTNTSVFTVEAWVFYTSSITAARYIVGKLGAGTGGEVGWNLQIRPGENAPELRTCNGSCFSTYSQTPLQLSMWRHIVATYDPSAMTAIQIYVNDVLMSADEMVGPDPVASSGPLTIGCSLLTQNPSSVFNGLLDEVAIYNRVLSRSEITAHFAAANP